MLNLFQHLTCKVLNCTVDFNKYAPASLAQRTCGVSCDKFQTYHKPKAQVNPGNSHP
jgi:hypothetical protein